MEGCACGGVDGKEEDVHTEGQMGVGCGELELDEGASMGLVFIHEVSVY